MPNLKIISAGLMTSIQDIGRKGLAYYAIPRSGAMDVEAAKMAYKILGQSTDFPLIECTYIAPKIQFESATQIVIGGADFAWTINNKTIERNQIIDIERGDILCGKFAKKGFRGYIGINGNWNLSKTYDSYSTYINAQLGGINGQLLAAGDLIEWENRAKIINKKQLVTSIDDASIIPIKKGPEYDFLTPLAQEQLIKNIYQIAADSNRMGARLSGAPLESISYQLQYSLAVLPGFIQLPPSGLPIVLLQDGQISGGYPRIAYIPEKYLSRFNQIALGGKFRFEIV